MRIPALLLSLFIALSLHAQDYSGLSALPNSKVKVYYSHGYEARARSISQRVDKAMDYYQELLQTKPSVTMLVITDQDWPRYTDMPVIGMPHYKDDSVLVVIAHDNAFWKSFVPPLDQLPAPLAEQVRKSYMDEAGHISMQPFFDLLALHELGHAFHMQAKVNMQRKWMQELFVNKEPAALPALTTFPLTVIHKGTAGFQYTSLKDVHDKYNEIGSRHPNNYGWYQCRWHAAAGKIYDADGVKGVKPLWRTLSAQTLSLGDDELIGFFEAAGMRSIAELIRNWDAQL